MPTYEYRCEHCGDFEQDQRITDAPLERCPKCRRKVRRLISNTSFQLKGGGWYVTDYARSGSGGSKDGGKSADKTDGKSEAKGDSKSETKADTKSESKPTSGGGSEKSAS
jgi:putative FmdB family regulatory protein